MSDRPIRFVQYIARMFTRRDSVVEVALDWSRALERLGYEAALVHGTPDVIEPPAGFDGEVTYVPHAGIGRNLVPVGFGKVLRPNDVLIMHTDWRASNYVAAIAARRAGVPYVIVPHGEYYPQQIRKVDRVGRPRRRAEQELIRHALGVHLFWPSEEQPVRPFVGATPCIVAPTGFVPAEGRWTGEGGYWSWLGRYVIDHKGLDLLAEAVAMLDPGERPPIELRGLDTRGDRARLKEIVDRLGVSGSVNVGDLVLGEEKEAFLRQAEVYLHPSRWECHSVALLENLSRGVPSLVTHGNHAAPELAEAEAAIVTTADVAGLADGIRRMRDADHGALSRRAIQFVQERLAWDRTASSFVEQVREHLR